MTRAVAEKSNALSIFYLKQEGFMNKKYSFQRSALNWVSGMGNIRSSIGFSVVFLSRKKGDERGYIELEYTYVDRFKNTKENITQRIKLVATKCNYGGERYWFECPLFKEGVACKKRVGILYSAGKYFGCRDCANVAYQAQFEGGNHRLGSIRKATIEKARQNVGRTYYNGKITKSYARYLKKQMQFNNFWTGWFRSVEKN